MIEINARNAITEPVFVQTADDREYYLIRTAQVAVNTGNWIVGQCASEWLSEYGRGRTDEQFGELIGLSRTQVQQRRQVWESFGKIHTRFKTITWTHFREALQWDDAEACLEWAEECNATVAEMRAWRRAQRGEDLFSESHPGDTSEAAVGPTSATRTEGRTIHGSVDERPAKAEPPPQRQNSPPKPPTLRDDPPTLRPEVTTLTPKDATVDPTTTVQMALRKIGHMIQFVVENGSASEKRELREKLSNFVEKLSVQRGLMGRNQ